MCVVASNTCALMRKIFKNKRGCSTKTQIFTIKIASIDMFKVAFFLLSLLLR